MKGYEYMKLAVAITVFNGLELLKSCVREMKKYSNDILITWQNVSWRNLEPPVPVWQHISKIENVNFIQHIPSRLPENEADITNLELCKREEARLWFLENTNCTHMMCMDLDEFYNEHDFKYMIGEIEKNKYDQTFTSSVDYCYPTWRLREQLAKNVQFPFINDIQLPYQYGNYHGLYYDPGRSVNGTNIKFFDTIVMNHYSLFRLNMKSKWDNGPVFLNTEYMKFLIKTQHHPEKYCDRVTDYFELTSDIEEFKKEYMPTREKQHSLKREQFLVKRNRSTKRR